VLKRFPKGFCGCQDLSCRRGELINKKKALALLGILGKLARMLFYKLNSILL
jgi:hypothetical protein